MATLSDPNSDISGRRKRRLFRGDFVRPEDRAAEAWTWLLLAMHRYESGPGVFPGRKVADALRDDVWRTYYQETREAWLRYDPGWPEDWPFPCLIEPKSIPPGRKRERDALVEALGGLQTALFGWLGKYGLTPRNERGDRILEQARDAMELWTRGVGVDRDGWPLILQEQIDTAEDRARRTFHLVYDPFTQHFEDVVRQLETLKEVISKEAERAIATRQRLIQCGKVRNSNTGAIEPILVEANVIWFLRYQVLNESKGEIANSPEFANYEDAGKAIDKACREVAELLGLSLRKEKLGRPSRAKKKTLLQ